MLEKMGAFFDARLDMYEEHQLEAIEGAREFYPFTASLLPLKPGACVLDLGCGTGLELDGYFQRNPEARVTGIDLAPGMLRALADKHPDKEMHLIEGSYFDMPLGEEAFDAAVSVESLHHFTAQEKLGLYRKLHRALKRGGAFFLTDYFAKDEEEESRLQAELKEIKRREGLSGREFYHFDTPLTVEHELFTLRQAGFSSVRVLKAWGNTRVLEALR